MSIPFSERVFISIHHDLPIILRKEDEYFCATILTILRKWFILIDVSQQLTVVSQMATAATERRMDMARVSKPPEERRQELIETAQELFTTQGYEQTTVGDIVKRVGVAQGLFYYYFRSKQDIFLALIDQFLEARIGELAAFLRDSQVPLLERVHNLMHVLMNFLRETEAMYPQNRAGMAGEMYAIMHNHVTEIIEPMVTKLLKESAEQGIPAVPFPDRLARFCISGFIGVQNMAVPPKADEMMEIILFALEQLLHIPKQALNADE